jgi:hypothetical protein
VQPLRALQSVWAICWRISAPSCCKPYRPAFSDAGLRCFRAATLVPQPRLYGGAFFALFLSVEALGSEKERAFAATRVSLFWLTPDLFRLRRITIKSALPNVRSVSTSSSYLMTPSNQGFGAPCPARLRRVPSFRHCSVGPARMGHPWPRASRGILPLGPLRNTSTRPPKVAICVVCGICARRSKAKSKAIG